MTKCISLGHTIVRLYIPEKDKSEYGRTSLEVMSPSFEEEGLHVPASSVVIGGIENIRMLSILIRESLETTGL